MGLRGSLSKAKRGRFGVLWGQSNSARCGNNTGPSPLSMPAGATYWEDALQLLSYTAPHHGVEVGILDEIINVAGIANATLVKRGVGGSTMSAWFTTHATTLIADCVTAGIVPAWGICVQGEAEAAAGEAAAQGWDDDCVTVLQRFRAAWGAAWPCIFVRIRTTDATNYPAHATVRSVQATAIAGWPHAAVVNVDDSPLATDGSGVVHYTSATAILAGRRAARALIDANVIL